MMISNRVSAALTAGLSILCLLGGGDQALAIGFGRPTSRAILGETLSVSVPVRLEAGDDLSDDCLAADVYFGDDKLSSSAIAAVLLPGSGAERTVRVSTTSLINEPVVTVYLVAGCKAKVSRKFVAFADPPGMLALPVSPPVADPITVGKAQPAPVSQGSVNASALAPGGAASDAPLSRAELRQQRRAEREAARQAARDARRAADAARAEAALNDSGLSPSAPADAQVADAPPRPARTTAEARAARQSRRPDSAGAAPTAAAPSDTRAASKMAPALGRAGSRDAAPADARRGARLELDPVEADAVVAPVLMMSQVLGSPAVDSDTPEVRERRVAAAALWAAMNASPEQLARDRLRMQELEQRLVSLQQTSAGASEKVAAMEARVRQAEDQRLRHPLVYGLMALCAVLLGAASWLFWRQKRLAQAQAAWWQGPGDTEAEAPDTTPASADKPALSRTAAEFKPATTTLVGSSTSLVSPVGMANSSASVDSTELNGLGSDAAQGLTDAQARSTSDRTGAHAMTSTRAVSIKPTVHEPVREITVEELIDLEQQAEFFVVLGQDDAAVELLESHVQTTAGASPLPHLKLLEIYQRLGRRSDYERVQSAFNGRFNAYAPSWESDLLQGHTLEEYPGVVERLQGLWSQPTMAMEVLQVSLTRPDDSVETFDLPAYRELLFLYSVARDLSERDAKDRAPVDLVLPVSGSGLDTEHADLVAPLMATRPVKATADASPSLSLDLSLDDPVPSGPGGFVDEPMRHDNSIDFELDVPQQPKN